MTASVHDHKPPLQHGPVERVAGHHGLAVNADSFPAGRALPENVDRIGLGFVVPTMRTDLGVQFRLQVQTNTLRWMRSP